MANKDFSLTRSIMSFFSHKDKKLESEKPPLYLQEANRMPLKEHGKGHGSHSSHSSSSHSAHGSHSSSHGSHSSHSSSAKAAAHSAHGSHGSCVSHDSCVSSHSSHGSCVSPPPPPPPPDKRGEQAASATKVAAAARASANAMKDIAAKAILTKDTAVKDAEIAEKAADRARKVNVVRSIEVASEMAIIKNAAKTASGEATAAKTAMDIITKAAADMATILAKIEADASTAESSARTAAGAAAESLSDSARSTAAAAEKAAIEAAARIEAAKIDVEIAAKAIETAAAKVLAAKNAAEAAVTVAIEAAARADALLRSIAIGLGLEMDITMMQRMLLAAEAHRLTEINTTGSSSSSSGSSSSKPVYQCLSDAIKAGYAKTEYDSFLEKVLIRKDVKTNHQEKELEDLIERIKAITLNDNVESKGAAISSSSSSSASSFASSSSSSSSSVSAAVELEPNVLAGCGEDIFLIAHRMGLDMLHIRKMLAHAQAQRLKEINIGKKETSYPSLEAAIIANNPSITQFDRRLNHAVNVAQHEYASSGFTAFRI